MAILIKDYELSYWEDIYNSTDNKYEEKKICLIGKSNWGNQDKANNVELTSNINGTHKLTFTMYYTYYDNFSGAKTENIFTNLLKNESKLKLHYDGEWYDFLIKDVSKNTEEKTIQYTAEDQFITELAKNGFNIELTDDLQNNMGTAAELGIKILDGTDWTVDSSSEHIAQLLNETLIQYTVNTAFNAKQINDINLGNITIASSSVLIPQGATIYGFYYYVDGKDPWFQFIYAGNATLITDSERIITNKQVQYRVYLDHANNTVRYYTNDNNLKCMKPAFCNNGIISDEYRANRYVFSQKSRFNKVLNEYVYEATKDNVNYEYYQKQKITTPNLIQNYIVNPNDYKSTSGWTGTYWGFNPKESAKYNAHIEIGAYDSNGTDIITDLLNNVSVDSKTYIPRISFTFKNKQGSTSAGSSMVRNPSFYSNRSKFEENDFVQGSKFVLYFKPIGLTLPSVGSGLNFKVEVGTNEYDINNSYYNTSMPTSSKYLNFLLSSYQNNYRSKGFSDEYFYYDATSQYYYAITSIKNFTNKTLKDFQSENIQTFISLKNTSLNTDITIKFEDFQIFPFIDNNTSSGIPFVIPMQQDIGTAVENTYYVYNKDTSENLKSSDEYVLLPVNDNEILTYLPEFYPNADAVRSFEVKESNRFNAIQTLCETFKCLAEFNISHNTDGTINSKQIKFKNYNNEAILNYPAFRYGVNLKSINRNLDSNQIVSKLIVKANNNEFAKNGFCTIARASSNETGENYIVDLSYYIQTGMIEASDYQEMMYLVSGAAGSDYHDDELWQGDDETESYNCKGYVPRIYRINKALEQQQDIYSEVLIPYSKAQADVTQYEAASIAAEESFVEAENDFLALTGYGWKSVSSHSSDYNDTNGIRQYIAALHKVTEAYANKKRIAEILGVKAQGSSSATGLYAQLINYESRATTIKNRINQLLQYKNDLNTAYYVLYSRFLQEGTWTSDEYIDDERYYIDARSTLYNSRKPKVDYTINVLDLSNIPGYEGFTYKLGQTGYLEDIEFFGKDINGNPIREDITITENKKNLDDPTKDTIKIQNFIDKFEDLFHKITATVQSVQYSTSAYERASELALADEEYKVKFLRDALNSSLNEFSNAGEQSVEFGLEGIIVTDLVNPSKKIRIIGGGLAISKPQEDGTDAWTTAITADGINVEQLTAGTIDTSKIRIMNGNQPTFYWDAHGLNAYAFESTTSGYVDGRIPGKGVRFDQYGIYGYIGITQADWVPEDIDDIRDNSTFSLTWDGLQIKGSQSSSQGATAPWTTTTLIDDNGIKIEKTSNGQTTSLFNIDENGDLYIAGSLIAHGISIMDNQNHTYLSATGDGNPTPTVEIAGWIVNYNELFKEFTEQNATYKVGISSNNAQGYAIYAGNLTTSSTPWAFRVDYQGSVWCSDLYITGGSISISDGTNDNFEVTSNGYLTAKGVDISGIINADEGTIGGWTISTDELHSTFEEGSTFYDIGMSSSSDSFAFYAGRRGNYGFTVNYDGEVNCSNLTITGGSIGVNSTSQVELGPWIISASGLIATDTTSAYTEIGIGYIKVDEAGSETGVWLQSTGEIWVNKTTFVKKRLDQVGSNEFVLAQE